MKYLIKVYQYKQGSTRKPQRKGDVLIEGREIAPNQTCVTQTLKGVNQERATAFVKAWITSPLGLTAKRQCELIKDCTQFINSGINDILFLEGYSKKKNRVEIYIEGGYNGD